MRAVSLVRYWLYGLRGFVVMTISLAVAFSIAITGPPTDHEIGVVTGVLNRAAADFGDDLEAAAIELCPQLPEEVGVVCAPTLTVEQPPPAQAEKPPLREVAADAPAPEVQPETQRASESQLLGAPSSQRARPERTRHRVNAERPTTQRAQPQRRAARAPPQRPARTQPARTTPTPAPAPEPAVVRLPPAEPPPVASDGASSGVAAEPARDDSAYAEEEDYQDWRERRRERRRRYGREAEPAPDDYYEDEYYEEGDPPEEYYERSDWPGDTH